LDNYERETGLAERVSENEKRELDVFLDAVCATDCARFARKYLETHGTDPRTRKLRSMHDFRNLLYDLWFAPYRRGAQNDSSGFEHVFVGEENTKTGSITGMHNWLQFYLEEQKGKIDYLGWAGRQDGDYSDDCNLVSVKFVWDDDDDDPDREVKPISTMLCGSTVEFELSVLTLAFLGGDPDGTNLCRLGNERCGIVCHSKRAMGGSKIGSAYLEIAK
jgi:poly(U)-specific endoribonuclease